MSIIYDENNNIKINTTNQQGRLKFGINKEKSFLDLLHHNNLIDFNGNEEDDVYNWCDYKFSNDKINIFLELKNRTNKLNTYPSTILAKNKVQNYLKNKDTNKKNYYFIIFGYLNDNKETDYYYIQYSKKFNDYDKGTIIYNKPHYDITVNELIPIENLFKILNNIIYSNN